MLAWRTIATQNNTFPGIVTISWRKINYIFARSEILSEPC